MQDWLEKPVFLSGATGFIGSHLYPKLVEEGLDIRCATRDPERAAYNMPGCEWVEFDVERPEMLARAMQGCGSAYYLIHQMQTGEGYREREVQAAKAFLKAAEDAGVRRVIYLGGVEPSNNAAPSEHLGSRLQTGRILRSSHLADDKKVITVELRASMIIGAGSASWKMVRDLAARLPAMVLPRWTQSRSQPVYIDDVAAALIGARTLPLEQSAWFDIPGPETLTAEDILRRVAYILGHDFVALPMPMLSPRVSSYWLRFVTRADLYMARELVEGLKTDLIAQDERFWTFINHPDLVPFDEAARRAVKASEPGSLLSRAYEGFISKVSRFRTHTPPAGGRPSP